jgi:hypothetical protein
MAAVGEAATTAADGAVTDIETTSEAVTRVNAAEMFAKMVKKGQEAAKGLV